MSLRRGALRAAVALVLLVAFAGVIAWRDMAQAQGQNVELQVNMADDAPDVQPGDRQCDSHAAAPGPQCSLRAAVMEANAILAQDPAAAVTIRLPQGTFRLTIPADPEKENGNIDPDAAGDLDILAGQGAEVRIVGESAATTVIQGGPDFDDRIFEVNNGVRASSGSGGGTASLWPSAGRAYAEVNGPARVLFQDLTIAGGKPTNQDLYVGGGAAGGGMAIYRGAWQGGGETALERVVIRDNVAEYGAGIFLRGGITIRDSAVVDNQAMDLGFPPAPGNPPCTRWIAGGGIYMASDYGRQGVDTRSIERTLIARNQALYTCSQDGHEGYGWYGGALVSHATLVNVTISDNHSTGVVGGVSLDANVRLVHVTIAGNRAERATGGVDITGFGPNRLFATIIAGNIAPQSPDCEFRGPEVWVSQGYNLIENPGSCEGGRYLDPPGDTDIFGQDPRLRPLGDWGGPTQSRPPDPASPAVDAIPAARCDPGVTTDQRGVQRPSGSGCDIGAVELQPADMPVTPPGNVQASAGDGRVTLTWQAVAGAESYVVYASRSPGVSKASYESRYPGITATSYQVTGLQNGVTYHFVVTAVRGSEESPESVEVSATPQAGLPRLRTASLPTAVVVGLPFDLQVEARTPDDSGRADLDGQVHLRVSGAHLRGADGSGAVAATMTDGLATFQGLVFESSPVGDVSFTVQAQGAEAATGSLKVALLLITHSVDRRGIAVWPVAVPGPGEGQATLAGKRFAHVRLLATGGVPQGCQVAAAGSPEGTSAPEVDDTVRIVPLRGGVAEDVTPSDGPVPVLTSDRTWAGMVLLSIQGNTYGSGDVYAVAPEGCQVGLLGAPVLEPDSLPAVSPHLTADTQEREAAEPLRLQVALSPPPGESLRSASLEIELPDSARLLAAQPAEGISLLETCAPFVNGGARRTCYALSGGQEGFLPRGVPVLTLTVLPAEGQFTARAIVTGAAGERFRFPGEEATLGPITVAPGQRAIVESVAQHYAAGGQMELTLRGFNVEGVDRIVLSRGGTEWAAESVQAGPGVVRATFSSPPEIGVYGLSLYRQGVLLQTEGESSIALAPAVPYIKVDVGRCAQPIIPPRPLATDVVVRNDGTMDADVLLLVVAEPWAVNPTLDRPAWSCGGGAEPVLPQLVNSTELRGPQGEQGFLVRLSVPAGGAKTFLVRRSLSQDAVNRGVVALGSRVVPVAVRIIGYAPAGAPDDRRCPSTGPCPVVLDVLERGWLAYVEAMGYLAAMGREEGQAYLRMLSRTAPTLADALLVAHIGQVSDEMDAVVAEANGQEVPVYGEGPAIVNSVASNVVQGIRNFLQDNADLFTPQTYLDTLKFTVQGFVDGTNAKYLTAAADTTVQAFTFGLVNPNWEPLYADAPFVEYARGVGTVTGTVYNYYATGGALKVVGTALKPVAQAGFNVVKRIRGAPVLPARIGNVNLALGYQADRGLYFAAIGDKFRLYIGALNAAPREGARWTRLLALDITQRTPQGAAFAVLRRCLLRGFNLEDCLNTEVSQVLTPEELAAFRWQLQNAGVTGNDLSPLEEQLEEARRRFYEANDGWRVNLKGETDQMSVPALSSYDPNEIAVTPAGPDGWVRSLDTVRATVRFENEGSGPAYDIRVDVPLPEDLDETSVRVEASSHLSYQVDPDEVDLLPPELHRSGNEYVQPMLVSFEPETRVLSFYFPNVLLPAASCEATSGTECNDGFVTFTVRPKRPLQQGDTISLYADIYFDLNPPVRTNLETRRIDAQGPGIQLQATARSDGTAVVTWDGQDPGSGIEGVQIALWREGDVLAPLSVQLLPAGQHEASFILPTSGRYRIIGYAVDRLGNAGQPTSVALELAPAGPGGGGTPPPPPPPTSVTVASPTGTGNLTFQVISGATPASFQVQPFTGTPPVPAPQGYSLPHGLYSLTAQGLPPGASITVQVTLPAPAPVGTVWLKLLGGSWVPLPVGDDDGDNVITITLTDGGQGDADGTANGVIADPGGPAIPQEQPTPTPSPTPPSTPPAAPGLVSLWPCGEGLACISFQPSHGATSYRLESALEPGFSFGLSSVEVDASSLLWGNTIVVGMPTGDMWAFYYRLSACNEAGCSGAVLVGGMAARRFPAGTSEHWAFVVGGYRFLGVSYGWAQSQVSVPGKASELHLYDGVQGYGGTRVHTCSGVQPGGSCSWQWASGDPWLSGSQEFPPYGEVGVAVRLSP